MAVCIGGLSTLTAAPTWNEPLPGQLTEFSHSQGDRKLQREDLPGGLFVIALKVSISQKCLLGRGRGSPWVEEAERGLHESPRGWKSQCAGEERAAPESSRDPQSLMPAEKLPTSRKRTARNVTGDTHQSSHGAENGACPHQPEQKTLNVQEEGRQEGHRGHSSELTRSQERGPSPPARAENLKVKGEGKSLQRAALRSGATHNPGLKVALFPPKKYKSKTWKDQTVSEDLSHGTEQSSRISIGTEKYPLYKAKITMPGFHQNCSVC